MANLTSFPASPTAGETGAGSGLRGGDGSDSSAPVVDHHKPDDAVAVSTASVRSCPVCSPCDDVVQVGVDVVAEPAELGVLDGADQQPANHPKPRLRS